MAPHATASLQELAVDAVPAQDTPREPLQLMTRKRSLPDVTQAGLEPQDEEEQGEEGKPRAPPLSPVLLEPLRWSTATCALSFLSNIERVEIRDAIVREGVTYYIVNVYLFHYNSRLPTNVNNPRLASQRASVSGSSSTASEPDFVVERRYSDFEKLRAQVRCWSCMDAVLLCDYCHEIVKYTRFRLRQPRLYVKLATNVQQRKRILERFLNDFVALAQYPNNKSHRCEAREHVPTLIESFIRD